MGGLYQISVEPTGPETYQVTVRGGGTSHGYDVEASSEEVASLGGGAGPEDLIEESFNFLLEREGPGAILTSFRLPDIARYFPDYPQEIRLRLEGTVG